MLRIKGISKCPLIDVKIDPYIAIDIDFGSWDPWLEPTAYWRTGDLKEQFIEVGSAENKGLIRSLTLVLIKQVILENKKIRDINLQQGVPIFERLDYDKNFLLDEVGQLEMRIGKDNLQVFFSDNQIISGLVCDRVTCLFDKENQFCGFEVIDITPDEKQILEKNFINRLSRNH